MGNSEKLRELIAKLNNQECRIARSNCHCRVDAALTAKAIEAALGASEPGEALIELQNRWIDWCQANMPQKHGGYPAWPVPVIEPALTRFAAKAALAEHELTCPMCKRRAKGIMAVSLTECERGTALKEQAR